MLTLLSRDSQIICYFVGLALIGACSSVKAIDNKTWEDISNYSVLSLISAALVVPSVKGDWQGTGQAFYSQASAQAITQIGKNLISEQRPDKSDNKSFPSGHAATAFASATTLHRRYGWKAGLPAYAMATLTGAARVGAKKHDWIDVTVGAAIGAATGWFFTDKFNEKVQLVPWVDRKSVGVQVTMIW